MNQKKAKALKRAVRMSVLAYEQKNPGKFKKDYKITSQEGKELWRVSVNHVHRLVRKHVRGLRLQKMIGAPISENNKAKFISAAILKANRFSYGKQKLGFRILGSHITEPAN